MTLLPVDTQQGRLPVTIYSGLAPSNPYAAVSWFRALDLANQGMLAHALIQGGLMEFDPGDRWFLAVKALELKGIRKGVTPAEIAGVSREYVNRVWKEVIPDAPSSDRSQDSQREVTRNGTTYAQNTARIGVRPAAPEPEAGLPAPLPEPVAEAVTAEPEPDFPPFDRATGEITEPRPAVQDVQPSYPPELLIAAQRPMSPAPYQPPSLEALQQDAQLEELRLVLSRLLSFKPRVNPEILSSGLMGGAVQHLALHVHEMLGDWLAFNQPESDPRTITVTAQVPA